jgi:HEAT repeat protein
LDDRLRHVIVAGHLGDEPAARAGLDDPSPDIRAAALGALARLDALRSHDLDTALADPERLVAIRAIELAIPRPEVALLPTTLSRDTAVVEATAWALGERGEGQPPEVVARLVALATDHTDALVREAAVAALGSIGDEAGLPAVLAATTDKPAIRRRAVVALAAFEGADVEAALQRATEDRDWQVRQVAEDLTSPRGDD